MKHPPNNPFSLTTKSTDSSTRSISNLRLQHLKIEVAEHLSQLQQGVNLNPNLIESTLWETKENMFALAYIGLDKQSLREIRVLRSKFHLKEWLKVLRKGTTLYKNYLNCLTEEAERLGLTLAELGTNEQELKELKILGFKVSAEGWLKRIAEGDYKMYFVLINYVREQVIAFGLTLADIDTTEEKLAELIVFAAKKEASSWLRYLRESSARNEYFTKNLRINVEIGGFALEDIGTDEKELQMLLARPSEEETKKLKSYTISRNVAVGQKNFLGNLLNNGLLLKVLLTSKKSSKRLEKQSV